MKIEYLTLYDQKKNDFAAQKKSKKFNVLPCSIDEINLLEEGINEGKVFPKAFREFLFIGGNYSGLPLDMNYSAMKLTSKYVISEMKKRVAKFDRPIAVFHQLDGMCYSFIYLDEGDNPQPWNCSLRKEYDSDEGESIWKTPFETFEESIEMLVDVAIKGMSL